jgi:methylmalonyl-CoA/ethylmalonyl-CoA epimerase
MFSRVHHVGIAVRDADSALAFYRDLLGLKVTKDAVIQEQGVRGILLAAGQSEIELLQPLEPSTAVGRFIERRGEGLHHLCFATDDIDAALADARNRGLPLIDEKPRLGLAGRIAFVHPRATHGVLVEYAEPTDETTATSNVRESKGANVTAFDHLAVVVSDVEPAARAYEDNFGFHAAAPVDRTDLGIRIAPVAVGEAFIGVIAPLEPNGPHARFLERRGEGLYLLSLGVERLATAIDWLRSRSVQIGDPVAAGEASSFAIISPRSANGVLVQLVERTV